jgi:hypothetical protein
MVKKRKPMAGGSRSVETREPNTLAGEKPNIVFCFKHFVDSNNTGQSLDTWACTDKKLLLGFLQKMVHISKQSRAEATKDSTITLYGKFPDQDKTDFSCPPGISKEENWGVLRNIGGQKARVAGFLKGDTFHVVFLDKEHKFWKSRRN